MTVVFLPDQPSGRQYNLTLDDGRRIVGVGRSTVEALARDAGQSVRAAETLIAKAKARALASAV
jgi:hypothetical protein